MTPDARLYATHNPDTRTPLPRNLDPFFAPIEDEPEITYSTPSVDRIFLGVCFVVFTFEIVGVVCVWHYCKSRGWL
jgi:hypothetical protein